MYYYDPNGKSPRRWAAIVNCAVIALRVSLSVSISVVV